MTLAATFMLGFLLGMRHAADADHIAAVATLATRSRSVAQTVLQGVAWGTGHTLTLMLFGGAVLVAGMMHGMAGSAALILLGLEAMLSPALALAYVAVFGVGSIAGMLLLSAAMAVPLRLRSRGLGRAHDALPDGVGIVGARLAARPRPLALTIRGRAA